MKDQYLLRIPKNIKEQLMKIANEKGYSMNALIMFIINDYLKEKEGEEK